MPADTLRTSNLPSGTIAPKGIYVVSHSRPVHAVPHEVLIAIPMMLPKCNACAGVRFSLKGSAPKPIRDCEFFDR